MSALELALPDWAAPYFVGPDAPGKGIISSLDENLYHGTKSLVSKSSLDHIARSPLHYAHHLTAVNKATPAMAMGSALHAYVLEPDKFASTYVCVPYFGDLRTNLAKAKRDTWLEENGEKIGLTEEQYAHVLGMRESLMAHPTVRVLLKDFEPEVTLVWTDPDTGIQCKGRADALSKYAEGLPVDIKSARDASEDGFRRAVYGRRYHVQDAFYTGGFRHNGIHAPNFIFPVVESEPPYAVGVYQLRTPSLLAGEAEYQRDLRTLAKCRETGIWTGYTANIRDIDIPAYGLSQAENMTDEDENDDH